MEKGDRVKALFVYEAGSYLEGISEVDEKEVFGEILDIQVASGRYPQFSSDFDIASYKIKSDSGDIQWVVEDYVYPERQGE